ncbi:MAG TPA: hypothetical protein VGG74_31540 [Kofleriaceae bacterium]|jgi:hypothetical protein
MYRDSATALDEHDRAVGAILIGEALIEECERRAVTVKRPETAREHDRWRAVQQVHDAFPEVWRNLDRARRVLAKRGANTVGYDELRPHVQLTATDVDAHIDDAAFDSAKKAIAELKLAVPGADWAAIAERTDGLVHQPLRRKKGRTRFAVAAVLGAFVLAVFAWLLSIVPEHKVSRHEKMRHELQSVVQQRKDHIAFLQAELGDRCLTATARDLVQQLVQDGRGADARKLGELYLEYCGYDRSIDNWAHAPRPGH